jgi:hypothetical protein
VISLAKILSPGVCGTMGTPKSASYKVAVITCCHSWALLSGCLFWDDPTYRSGEAGLPVSRSSRLAVGLVKVVVGMPSTGKRVIGGLFDRVR